MGSLAQFIRTGARLPKFLPLAEAGVAYVQQRKAKDGTCSYRGFYKTADGRWRSAGTFTDEDRALEVAAAAEPPPVQQPGTGPQVQP
jgi:hypothetical protein